MHNTTDNKKSLQLQLSKEQALQRESLLRIEKLLRDISKIDLNQAYTKAPLQEEAFTHQQASEHNPVDRFGTKIELGKKALLLTKGKSRANKGVVIKVSATRTTIKDKSGQRYWREHYNIKILN